MFGNCSARLQRTQCFLLTRFFSIVEVYLAICGPSNRRSWNTSFLHSRRALCRSFRSTFNDLERCFATSETIFGHSGRQPESTLVGLGGRPFPNRSLCKNSFPFFFTTFINLCYNFSSRKSFRVTRNGVWRHAVELVSWFLQQLLLSPSLGESDANVLIGRRTRHELVLQSMYHVVSEIES